MALKSDKKLISSTCIILPVLVNGRPTCRFTLHFFSSSELHQPVLYCAIQCSPMSFPRWPLQRTAAHPSIVELQKGCKTPQNGAKLPAMAYFARSHQSAGLRQGFKFADCLELCEVLPPRYQYYLAVGDGPSMLGAVHILRQPPEGQGDSYFNEFLNFALGIPTSCSILFTDFKTVFVFALGRFVPVVVNFYDLQCKCTRERLKMAEKPLSSGQMLILRCGM